MLDPLLDLGDTKVSRTPFEAQLLLHAEPADADAIAHASGVLLSTGMLTASEHKGWMALHLSPDEWLLIGDRSAGPTLIDRFRTVDRPHSLVDVSSRSLSLDIVGKGAIDLLSGGCPLDLERMSEGSCTRSLFGKATILLWHHAHGWRLSYQRSLDSYIIALLRAIAIDIMASPTT